LLQQDAMNSPGVAEFVRGSRFSGFKRVWNGMVSEVNIYCPSLLCLMRGVIEALRERAADRGEFYGADG
jgi:deoxyadenosine/deoxycytidine kinase